MEIKRIIFDLDNTLIDWKEEYDSAIAKTFEYYNLECTNKDVEKINKAISIYEKSEELKVYNREKMQEIFEQELGYKLPKDFIIHCLEGYSCGVPDKLEEDTINTLEYLSKKYDLVILTNWFKEGQVERLKKVDILKYFSNVYAPETFYKKPYKESYEIAKGKYKKEECLMVGDNYKVDIQGAISYGIKAILIDKKNKASNEVKEIKDLNFVSIISKLSELTKIL